MIEANNKRDIFLLCIGLGVGFNVLSGLVFVGFWFPISPPGGVNIFIGSAPTVVAWGIFIGMFWSAFAIPVLRRKPMWRASKLLLMVVTPVVLLSTLLLIWTDSNTSMLIIVMYAISPTVAFILTCLYARISLPNISYGSDQCQHCGEALTRHCQNCDYDLTGNVSGVCPECGTKIEQ